VLNKESDTSEEMKDVLNFVQMSLWTSWFLYRALWHNYLMLTGKMNF